MFHNVEASDEKFEVFYSITLKDRSRTTQSNTINMQKINSFKENVQEPKSVTWAHFRIIEETGPFLAN